MNLREHQENYYDAPSAAKPPVFPDTGHKNRLGGGAADQFAFFQKRSTELLRFLIKFGLPREDAEDVIQNIWLKFFARPAESRGEDAEEHGRAWLLKVALHEGCDLLRHRWRHRAVSLNALPQEPRDRRVEEAAALKARERAIQWVGERLAELSEKKTLNDRLVYERYFEGRSVRELAAEHGLKENAVSCRIYQTLQKLRVLAPKPEDEDRRPR